MKEKSGLLKSKHPNPDLENKTKLSPFYALNPLAI